MTRHDPELAAPAAEETAQAGGILWRRGSLLSRLLMAFAIVFMLLRATEFAATQAPLWFSGVGGWALTALLCVPVFGALGLVYGWFLGRTDDLYPLVIPSAIVVVFSGLMRTDSPLSGGLGLLLASAVVVTALVMGRLLAARWRVPGARTVPGNTPG